MCIFIGKRIIENSKRNLCSNLYIKSVYLYGNMLYYIHYNTT